MTDATNTWKSWRKCWQDIRSRTKCKMSIVKTEANRTGGGPLPPLDIFTAMEEDIYGIIKKVSVEGDPSVDESTATFKFGHTKILPLFNCSNLENNNNSIATNEEKQDKDSVPRTSKNSPPPSTSMQQPQNQ
nr:uncharacterized protein LOC111513373 [Leptinotarsa decemlineata]